MRYWTLGHRLPSFVSTPLFGDRRRFGYEINEEDPDWQEWQSFYMDFYQDTQKSGVGKTINDSGYQILQRIDLEGKRVMEVGPGVLPHLRFWNGKPASYAVVDIKPEFLDHCVQSLEARGIRASAHRATSEFPDGVFDVVVSFYSLEHLHPLDRHVQEFKRVIRPGGILVGGVPCEGGLAWGGGRLLTSRRYIKAHSTINPDKLICWEHPNFAERILQELDRSLERVQVNYYPLRLPLIDLNLIVSFVYRRVE